MAETFVTTIMKGASKNTTGIAVPPEVVSALGSSKKPAVRVALNGYTYRSTVASMGGKFAISLSAGNRKSAGLEGGERIEVTLELDTEPRVIPIPPDLKTALVKARALAAFEKAAPSRRKEFVRQVEEAKASDTRERRISRILAALQSSGGGQ
jgi:Domain of unknown function (DUF1905)/Bacteriocin-protection, YdeI or OmpD-Associated